MAKGTCVVDGCTRTEWSRGWCGLHYGRQRRIGTVELKPQPTVVERFWAKVNKSGPTPVDHPELGPCWLWTAHIMATGYGQFSYGTRPTSKVLAHRRAYELAVGSIPDGLHVDHLCRNRACVNPRHLEPVTQAENNRRAWITRPRRRAASIG